jgi:sigma-B regulation protein RsbU (phosphoserine phosphatase)
VKILIAEDDPTTRHMLNGILSRWGYEVAVSTNGAEAWDFLQADDTPRLAVLDWDMPQMTGIDVVRRMRATPRLQTCYVLMLTAHTDRESMIEALDAGANDFVMKPFHAAELRARIGVGSRVVELQTALERRIIELEEASLHIKTLQGILPICAYCKKIRDDKSYWHQVERYVMSHTDAQFSHSVCPDCYQSIVRPQIAQLKKQVQ